MEMLKYSYEEISPDVITMTNAQELTQIHTLD